MAWKHQPVPDGYRPVRETLPIALTRAREAIMSYWRPLLAEGGFTEQQWRVLRVVNEHEPIDLSTLSLFAALHMPSATRIVRSLEARGYLKRRRDPADSRRHWICTSEKAREAIYANGERARQLHEDLVSGFGEAKLAQLSTLLQELAALRRDDG